MRPFWPSLSITNSKIEKLIIKYALTFILNIYHCHLNLINYLFTHGTNGLGEWSRITRDGTWNSMVISKWGHDTEGMWKWFHVQVLFDVVLLEGEPTRIAMVSNNHNNRGYTMSTTNCIHFLYCSLAESSSIEWHIYVVIFKCWDTSLS